MNTRDRIIEAADSLFYAGSIRGVSLDKVAERAGLTKKTLYYHFQSKDELIAAYLSARHEPTLERYQAWSGQSEVMQERVEGMFEALALAVQRKDWRGCGFIRAAVELADSPGHPALRVARHHKASFEGWLKDDIAQAGYVDAETIARAIMVLLDGAVVRMLVHRDEIYARTAGQIARKLLDCYSVSSPELRLKYTD